MELGAPGGSARAEEVGPGRDQWLTFHLCPAPTRLFGQQRGFLVSAL